MTLWSDCMSCFCTQESRHCISYIQSLIPKTITCLYCCLAKHWCTVSLSYMLHLVPFNHHTKFLCSALCRFMYYYWDWDCLCVFCISEMKMFVTHLALYMSQIEIFQTRRLFACLDLSLVFVCVRESSMKGWKHWVLQPDIFSPVSRPLASLHISPLLLGRVLTSSPPPLWYVFIYIFVCMSWVIRVSEDWIHQLERLFEA